MSEQTEKNENTCFGCPGARLTTDQWLKLARPPFRKRHPVLFWGSWAIVLLLSILGLYHASTDENNGVDRIALISITGPIMDVSSTLEWIRSVGNNPSVKGVLVRVDSPGGGAAASQEIYQALLRLRKRVPIVISMGATAASGGLMVSMAGERIYANPSTVTGSIGVRMDIPQLQGLMGKLGIGQETLTTGPYKDATSVMRPLTPEDRAYLEHLIMNMHEQFVDIVATGRNMPKEKVQTLANGKIYTGQEALELGLIDALGGQEDAHDWVAEKAGIPASRKLLKKPITNNRLLERLLGAAEALQNELGTLSRLGKELSAPAFSY